MEIIEVAKSPVAVCINCGNEVSTKFCPACGQANPPRKLNFGNMWYDFQSRIYGFDGMFPRTLKDLTIRPGKATREYIEGNRLRYYGPVGYFFLMITLMYLVASILGIDIIDFLRSAGEAGFGQKPKAGSGQEQMMQGMMKVVSDNMKLITFIYIPIMTFCAHFLFFRKSGNNFLENSVLPFYLYGHFYWVSIFSLLLFFFFGFFLPNSISFVLQAFYFSYGFANFYTYQGKVKAFFKGFGVYLTSMILFSLLVVVVVVLVLLFNHDAYEMMKPSNNR